MKKLISLVSIALALATHGVRAEGKAKKAALLPIAAFASLPTYSRAQLSPDGGTIAFATNYKGKTAIVLQNLNGAKGSIIPPMENMDINSFSWTDNDVLLIQVGALLKRAAFKGKAYNTRTFSFNRKSGKFIWLGKPKSGSPRVRGGGRQQTSQLERVTDYLPNDPKHILMQFDFDIDGMTELYKVNVYTGKRKQVRKQKRGVQNWYTDHNSEVRLGTGYFQNKWSASFKGLDGKWVNLDKVDWAKKYDIEGFAADPNMIYVSGRSEHGTDAIYKLDLRSGQIVETIFSHEEVDVSSVAEHPLTGHLAGVTYVDDFYRIKYFDKDLAKIQRSLDHALKGSVNTIVSRAKDKEYYLLFVEDDKNPGDYYLFDRAKGQLHYIAAVHQQLDVERTATTQRVTIPVRDGDNIPAYLSIPHGAEAKGLPTVILPHGGPQARDSAEWDFWAQFYASRGYAVLKPNFRGSTGYGDRFRAKGFKQWGGLMQDDVTDATKWMISEGIADPDRICIVGASYGGYAALMGVIKEPGLYKCAISVNGVTDVPRMKTADASFIGGRSWGENMALKDTKDTAISPYDRAEDINSAVLLMSSVDDERIPYQHSKSMHSRLKKLKKDSRYVEISDGGHSMITQKARMTLLAETEKFLEKHIGN